MSFIVFSHDYPKLEKQIFPTIRRHDRYKIGKTYEIRVKHRRFKAKLKTPFDQISKSFFEWDTELYEKGEIHKLFNSLYRIPIDKHEIMTILFLEKVEEEKE